MKIVELNIYLLTDIFNLTVFFKSRLKSFIFSGRVEFIDFRLG